MKLRQWPVEKMVVMMKDRWRVTKRLILTRTAHIRRHTYVNTGISINKLPEDRYAGDVLRCERCDRVRVVLSDGEYGKAMHEKGCVGFRNGVLKV